MTSFLSFRPVLPRFAPAALPGATVHILAVLAAWFILAAGAAPARATLDAAAPPAADTLKVTLSAPDGGTVAEGATGHFEVSVAGSTSGGAVTVQYSVSGTAVAGTDYEALSGEATVAQGESVARIALSALEDGILDKGETVVLALTGATGPGTMVVDATAATATIADNGTVTLSLTPAPDTIDEGSSWSSTVTMSTPVADRVSVRWWTSDGSARAGRDYRAANEVVSFQPGETSKPIKVKTLQDDDDEPVEVFYVSLDPPSISTRAATANSVRVNAEARSAFIRCSVSFPDDVTTAFKLNETASSGTVVGTVAADTHGLPHYSLTGGQNKFTINDFTGEITTAGALNRSSYHVTVTVSDGCGATASVDVTIEVNRTPERVGTIPDDTVKEDDSGSVDVSSKFRDPDGDPLTYTVVSSPSSVVGVSVSGSTVTYEGNAVGDATVTVRATDGGGLSATQSFAVTVERPNRPPEPVGRISDDRLEVGQSGSVDVSSKFRDPDGDDLGFEVKSSDPSVVRVSVSGSDVTYRGEAVGSATVTVTADDGNGGMAEQEFDVTVVDPNGPPDADAGDPQTVDKGSLVLLDGRGSSDPDPGDWIAGWDWDRTAGPQVTLSGETTATPTFEAPERDHSTGVPAGGDRQPRAGLRPRRSDGHGEAEPSTGASGDDFRRHARGGTERVGGCVVEL